MVYVVVLCDKDFRPPCNISHLTISTPYRTQLASHYVGSPKLESTQLRQTGKEHSTSPWASWHKLKKTNFFVIKLKSLSADDVINRNRFMTWSSLNVLYVYSPIRLLKCTLRCSWIERQVREVCLRRCSDTPDTHLSVSHVLPVCFGAPVHLSTPCLVLEHLSPYSHFTVTHKLTLFVRCVVTSILMKQGNVTTQIGSRRHRSSLWLPLINIQSPSL